MIPFNAASKIAEYCWGPKSYTCTNLQYNAFGIEIDSIFESSLQTYTPIDIGTEDYQKFEQTKTLLKHGGFQTDYTSHYGLICISSRYDYVEESLFKQYDPSVKYRRHRKLIETTKLTEDNFEYFNRLNNICNKVNGNNILLNKELIGKNIIHGTNWFIIYDENIIYSNYLNNDEIAIIEINETINNIKTKII